MLMWCNMKGGFGGRQLLGYFVKYCPMLRMRSFGGPGGRACPGHSRRGEGSEISKSPPNRSQIRQPPAWDGLPARVSPSVTATPHVIARKPALRAVEWVAISAHIQPSAAHLADRGRRKEGLAEQIETNSLSSLVECMVFS